MSGVGPTATTRVGLTCTEMSDVTLRIKKGGRDLGLGPIIMDFDVLEVGR